MPNLSVYYNENGFSGKDYYALYPNNKDNQSALLDGIPFSEMSVIKAEDKYFLYGLMSYSKTPRFTVKAGKEESVVSDQNLPVCIPIRYKEGKNWKDEIESPTDLEIKLANQIDELALAVGENETEKLFSCKLVADSTNAKTIAEDSGFFYIEFCELDKKSIPALPLDKVFRKGGNANNGQGGKKYTPPPTAYEKANDRLKFVLESFPTEWNINSLADLAIYCDDNNKSVNGTPLKDISDKEIRSKIVISTFDLALKLLSADK